MRVRSVRIGRRKGAVVLLVIGCLFLVLFAGRVVSVVQPIGQGFVQMGTWVYEKAFWFTTAGEITPAQLQVLKEERDNLAARIVEQGILLQTIDEYKALLSYVERQDRKTITASLIAKSPSGTTSQFVIGAGYNSGVSVGDPIVVQDGRLLGKVLTVGPRTSTAIAVTDQGHATAVSLFNESQTIGVASGLIGDLLRIDFIPPDQVVAVGDLVVTSGLEGNIPSGLLVGVVNAVELDPSSPFQSAVVEPLADLRRTHNVVILLNQNL